VPNEPAFTFEDTTIYDSHRGALRLMRRLLNPLLKLFFNPNPVIRALHLQARLNVEAAERDAERDRRQTEWNALHYEIVQRLVTEVSRVSIELQSLSMRVESLDAKVDFNERRVRSIEGSVHRSRPQGRPAEPVAASPAVGAEPAPVEAATETATAAVEGQPSDGTRRRRRRRRGRRIGIAPGEAAPVGAALPAGAPSIPFDTHPEPRPAVERLAQDTDAAPAPPERAAPEPLAGQPDADRTEH
jgi:cell division protein FtsL